MPLHDFILPKSDTNSTVFDFLVIFCSFYVYSLVPGVWHFFISGLYLISTIRPESKRRAFQSKVSMPSRAYTSFLLCQYVDGSIEAFVMCQCPLGLIPHFYYRDCYYQIIQQRNVSMPSRAYTSFLRYPFKNLGFMRFPEPVFAGIYQNILTTAVFRAC